MRGQLPLGPVPALQLQPRGGGCSGQLCLQGTRNPASGPCLQVFMAKLNSAFRRSAISMTDKRVQTMNEFVTCIKLIKMYAWERPFTQTIRGRRAPRGDLPRGTGSP